MRGHIACAPVLSRIAINHADVFKVDDSSYCSFSIVAIDILKVIFFFSMVLINSPGQKSLVQR